jgi:regulator of nucleoside diphosphate kinase
MSEISLASYKLLVGKQMLNTDELIISQDDYARLCALGGSHELAAELDRAIVVSAERMPVDVVAMYSRVVYVDESLGTRREVEVVYPEEANPATGQISVLAPVGSALLGLTVGRSIDWEYPGGEVRRLRIERVLTQPGPQKTRKSHDRRASRSRMQKED